MECRYLLDTNIASYAIKGKSAALDRCLVKVPMTDLAISVVTEAELRYGLARLPQATRLNPLVEHFLLRVSVLPWNSEAARHYALLRATLERDGRSLGNLDLMIAAHALASGLVLVTNDKAFSRIDKLKVEDWTKQSSH